jgi:hypothetical protein
MTRRARRRWVMALAGLGLADAVVVALRQTGQVRRLPDLPGAGVAAVTFPMLPLALPELGKLFA